MARRRRCSGALMRYAEHGPSPRDMVRYSHEPSRVTGMLEDWRRWQVEHLASWRAGQPTPPPPHADLFLSGEDRQWRAE